MPHSDGETNLPASPDRPWYADGLRFECSQCGNCCTGAPGAVWVSEEEVLAIAEYLGKSLGEMKLLHTRPLRGALSLREFANGDCEFFDGRTRRCTIYPVRPTQCRTWPFWRSHLVSPQDWQDVQLDCPGAGCGTLVTLDEIERRASQIEL